MTGFGVVPVLEEQPLNGALAAGYLAQVAPERVTDGAITPRSDVFALGVLLFEALTGRLPWSTASAAFVSPNLRQALQAQAPPTIPTVWADLIVDCLRFDPSQRPADVRMLLARLGAPAFQA